MALSSFQAILWDFDGVLMDSNAIRDIGFIEVLENFPNEQVEKLVNYHKANGGLSRYHKFRYFYENILGEPVTEEMITWLAGKFSEIMRRKLLDASLIIKETASFVKKNYISLPMFIVSGSDQNELRSLCESHGLKDFFKGIFGSPTPKKQLVRNILDASGFNPAECLLIGDSINDYEAADTNGLQFMAYNNLGITQLSTVFIDLRS